MDEENQQLDTSTETSTEAIDTTGADIATDADGVHQVQESSDWRVKKYGDNWKDNIQYHTETNDYLRKELDRAKAQIRQSRRGIEQDDAPAQPRRPAASNELDGEKFQGETTEEFEKYLTQRAERLFETKLEARERENNFRQSVARAREQERGDPENGIPSFEEVEEAHLTPLMKQNVADRDILIPKGSSIIKELLRHLPDPGRAAYTLGVMLKAQNSDGLRKMFAGQGREELAKKINETAKGAATLKNGSAGRITGKLTPADLDNMSPEEFSKFRAKQRGLMT